MFRQARLLRSFAAKDPATDSVVRSSQATLKALGQFTHAQRVFSTLDAKAAYRGLCAASDRSTEQIDGQVRATGSRPSLLAPLFGVAFGVGGAASAVLGSRHAARAMLAVQKAVEDQYDESLRELSASGVDSEQLRQALRECRDRSYEGRRHFDSDAEADRDPSLDSVHEKVATLTVGVVSKLSRYL